MGEKTGNWRRICEKWLLGGAERLTERLHSVWRGWMSHGRARRWQGLFKEFTEGSSDGRWHFIYKRRVEWGVCWIVCVCVDAVAEWHVWLGEVVSWWLRISQLAKRERVRKRGEDDHDAPICLPHANPCSSFINLRCAQQCKVTFHWCKCARIPQHKSALHICTHSIGKSQIRLGLKLSVLDFSLVFRSCLPIYSLKKRL